MGQQTTSSLLRERLDPARPRGFRAGFSLIELLVVMGIIVLLISILLPALNKAYTNANRTRMGADLQTIGQALESYRNDFGDYPRPGTAPPNSTGQPVSGASVLCWALVAPGPLVQDGYGEGATGAAPAPGFRLRSGQGKVYGPYVNLDSFQIGTLDGEGKIKPGTGTDDYNNVIGDRNGHPILYFVANRGQLPTTAYVKNPPIGTTGPTACMYNYTDNAQYIDPTFMPLPPPGGLSLKIMQIQLGDLNYNGMIDLPAETAVTTAPYILWSAGPDGKFGPNVNGSAVLPGPDDDVSNVPLNDIPPGTTFP